MHGSFVFSDPVQLAERMLINNPGPLWVEYVDQTPRYGPEIIRLCSYSTQSNMKLQLLIKTKMLKIKILFALKLSAAVFIFGILLL